MKITIPYYLHKAGAGFPSPATDYIEEDIDLNVHLIKNVPATFVIRVQGRSMTDVGINDGDILVVDKSLKPKNFSTVIANVHDELVVKSFVQERDKKFLTSGSKSFKDRILINEEEDIFIWGYDWGRWVNITYSFSILFYIYLFKKSIISNDFKIKNNLWNSIVKKKILISLIFFIFAFSWAPKTVITGDLGSFPIYRIPYKAFKIINN